MKRLSLLVLFLASDRSVRQRLHNCRALVITLAVLLAAVNTSHGISIILDFNGAASDTPPFDLDGSLLTTTMQAVQSRYQDVFEDNDHTITINYWWDDLANLGGIHSLVSETGGNNSRETEANLRFDTRIGSGGAFKQYFFDSTPLLDEEFTMAQVLYGTGLKPSQKIQFFNGTVPSLLEVGYTGTAIPGGAADGLRDILSLAFHETGHALDLPPRVKPTFKLHSWGFPLTACGV